MDSEEIFVRVKEILIKQLKLEKNIVTKEASFRRDLGADSLDTVEFILSLERIFGLDIPNSVLEKIVTVSDLVEYIKTHT